MGAYRFGSQTLSLPLLLWWIKRSVPSLEQVIFLQAQLVLLKIFAVVVSALLRL
jgi:hypothetical protein